MAIYAFELPGAGTGSNCCFSVPWQLQFASPRLLSLKIISHALIDVGPILRFVGVFLPADTFCDISDRRFYSGSECRDANTGCQRVNGLISLEDICGRVGRESKGYLLYI